MSDLEERLKRLRPRPAPAWDRIQGKRHRIAGGLMMSAAAGMIALLVYSLSSSIQQPPGASLPSGQGDKPMPMETTGRYVAFVGALGYSSKQSDRLKCYHLGVSDVEAYTLLVDPQNLPEGKERLPDQGTRFRAFVRAEEIEANRFVIRQLVPVSDGYQVIEGAVHPFPEHKEGTLRAGAVLCKGESVLEGIWSPCVVSEGKYKAKVPLPLDSTYSMVVLAWLDHNDNSRIDAGEPIQKMAETRLADQSWNAGVGILVCSAENQYVLTEDSGEKSQTLRVDPKSPPEGLKHLPQQGKGMSGRMFLRIQGDTLRHIVPLTNDFFGNPDLHLEGSIIKVARETGEKAPQVGIVLLKEGKPLPGVWKVTVSEDTWKGKIPAPVDIGQPMGVCAWVDKNNDGGVDPTEQVDLRRFVRGEEGWSCEGKKVLPGFVLSLSDHASVRAYPKANVSAIDRKTGHVVRIKEDGRTLTCSSRDGRQVWQIVPPETGGLRRTDAEPVLSSVAIEDGTVTIDGISNATLDLATGEVLTTVSD